jgi:hypothetical protein
MAERQWFCNREGVSCPLPTHLPADEAAIYQKLRALHCADRRPGHQCHGKVSLERNGMTLSCPRCGDHRSLYPPVATDA